MRRQRLALILTATVVAGLVIGYFINSSFFIARDVSINEIVSDPQSFDGVYVLLQGYVVDTRVYMFGPKYVLRDFDDEVEIALGSSEKVDLESYVSYVFGGKNYTQIRNLRVSVVGHVRYIGPVVDAPSFLLDIGKVEPSVTELETIVMDFLKTADVANGGWDNTVEIMEVYDHRFGGKVAVVKYATVNAAHPHFMCEAIEHHTAVITLYEKGQVVSAFCLLGSFHDRKIWDLLNQRWVQE